MVSDGDVVTVCTVLASRRDLRGKLAALDTSDTALPSGFPGFSSFIKMNAEEVPASPFVAVSNVISS